MIVNDYQQKAHETADYPSPATDTGFSMPWVYPAMGLAEEAGKSTGKFAKIIRDKRGIISEEERTAIVKELGDVLWMVSECAFDIGVSLEEVMQKNLDKLASRKARNVIHGNGDDR